MIDGYECICKLIYFEVNCIKSKLFWIIIGSLGKDEDGKYDNVD